MRLVWDFKRASISSIRKVIKMVDWRFMFSNKNFYKQVSIFNNTLMNIFTNYITNKYITTDDKDPPWMNKTLKNKNKLNQITSLKNKHYQQKSLI